MEQTKIFNKLLQEKDNKDNRRRRRRRRRFISRNTIQREMITRVQVQTLLKARICSIKATTSNVSFAFWRCVFFYYTLLL